MAFFKKKRIQDHNEIYAIYNSLIESSSTLDDANFIDAISKLEDAVDFITKSFSGSWLGYHSRVYYADLQGTPSSANFSQEWGLMDSFSMGSIGNWRQFSKDEIRERIFEIAGNPDLNEFWEKSDNAAGEFETYKFELLSVSQVIKENYKDDFLNEIVAQLKNIKPLDKTEVISAWSPRGQIMTRDTLALGQGNQIPPHVEIAGEIVSIKSSFDACREAAIIAKRMATHMERLNRTDISEHATENRVFIGHGNSPLWRELKDFINDRLSLEWDEFNRVPVAGTTNISRLSEMLDNAAIALIILTGEDETKSGQIQARMNVVHEVGLFQGRLGFNKAIVLLEDGCEQFSNIEGLSQIRFPRGNISASFEKIRAVLEREKIL